MKKTSQQADEKEDGADLSRTKRIGYSSFQRQLSGPNNRRSSVRNIRETFENAAKNDEVKSGDSVKFHRSDSVKSTSGDKESDTSSVNVSVNGVTKKPSVVKVSKIPVVGDRLHRSSVGGDSGEGDTSVKEGKFSEINTDSVVTKEKPESPVVLRSEIGRETNNNNQVHPEKAQDRLAKSQSLIEQLQQNLATQISTATVEAFKHDYSPALEKSILERSNIHTPSSSRKAPGAISSSKIDNNSNFEEKNIRQPSEQKETEKGDNSLSLKRRKLQFFNGIFGPSAPKSVNKPAVKRKDSGDVISPEEGQENKGNRQANGIVHSVVDSVGPLENKKGKEGQDTSDAVKGKNYSAGTNGIETAGELKPNEVRRRETVQTKVSLKGDETIGGVKSPASDKNSCDNSIVKQDNPKPERDKHIDEGLPIGEPVLPSKPARVSWTTRLIQKLTEEETRKKNKPQIKVQKPKRLVRFPQRKEPKPDKPDKPKLNEVKKKPSEVSREIVRPVQIPINYSETDSGATQQEEVKIENVSGVVLDDNNKDAYASLITQLVDTPLGGQSDFEEVSEVDSEAKLLKQKKLEEIRAALAREECGTSSSDDESVIALNTSFASSDSTTAITASTGSKELLGEAGKGRKENKPSGIRRLLPQGLFSSNQKNRPLDRRDEDAVLEPLLKTNKSVIGRGDYSRVYPTTSPKPVLETAFLSDSQSKVPNDPRFRQHQRSQSTSPASRHKQTSPKIRRHHLDSPYVDQTSIQENEQNTSRINSQNRSKSLSPSRDRRSSATSPNAKRTIPDTSLILEERLQNIRRELSSPPPGGGVGGVRRPSSTTPADRPNRVQQRQHSLPSSPAGRRPSNKLLQQDQIYQNAVRGYTSNGAPPIPSDAYYHSPPSRRKQQNKIAQNSPNDHRLEEYYRKVSGGSSASSTSTIVADSPSNSSSWNPLLLNLEHQAISGSPDIRKLQQQRHHRTADDTGIYGEIRNGSYSDSPGYRENAMLNRRHLASPRTDSPDVYYHQNSGIVDKPQGLLQVQYNPPLGQQRSPSSVPSGRLSAPPVPSHNVEDYPRRRVISPEPHRSRQEYPPQPNKRSTSQPPISRQPYRDTGPPHPSFQPIIPTEKRVVLPVGAQVKITAPPQPQQRQDHPINKETQTARSYVQQQQYRHLATAPDGPKESPQNLSPSERPQNVSQKTPPEQGQRQYKKLSRQEIEALYWETQKFREGLSSLSKQFSPNVPRLGERYPSTSSLPPQLSPAQMNAMRPQQNSPMLSPHYQTDGVPRQPYRTQSAINVGSGYGSLIVKPQPIYNNVQHYQNYQMIQQARGQQENPLPSPAAMRVPRARSVSPGPNSNRHLSSRSLSLPRSISGNILIENQMPNQRKIGEDNYFSRGIPQRNTIGPIRTSQHSPQIRQQATPTIYEEPPQHNQEEVLLRHPERVKNTGDMNQKISSKSSKPQSYTDPVPNRALPAGDGGSKKSGSAKKGKKSSSDQQPPLPQQQQSPYCPPIFKRGSLISNSTSSVDGVDNQGPPYQLTPKRVSFTSNYMEGQPEPVYWPTRNGPAPEPPTRQRKSRPDSLDSDVFLPNSPHNPRDEYSTYANVPATMAHHYQPPGYGVISPKLEAPNRPLPPVPREASHGVFSRKSRGDKDFSGFSSVSHRWQQQSESESGSEAGEVQRILQQGSHSRGGTYFRFPGRLIMIFPAL
ncbi:serine-rich adhesin for platelets-like [Periplaneta americana]|uniref:serine-rich adhesin for platelets-like n=1 Tax=Periplaneta americana TaxID=6978 RepID=UPI0037E85551